MRPTTDRRAMPVTCRWPMTAATLRRRRRRWWLDGNLDRAFPFAHDANVAELEPCPWAQKTTGINCTSKKQSADPIVFVAAVELLQTTIPCRKKRPGSEYEMNLSPAAAAVNTTAGTAVSAGSVCES